MSRYIEPLTIVLLCAVAALFALYGTGWTREATLEFIKGMGL